MEKFCDPKPNTHVEYIAANDDPEYVLHISDMASWFGCELHLRKHAPSRDSRQIYVDALGKFLESNLETFHTKKMQICICSCCSSLIISKYTCTAFHPSNYVLVEDYCLENIKTLGFPCHPSTSQYMPALCVCELSLDQLPYHKHLFCYGEHKENDSISLRLTGYLLTDTSLLRYIEYSVVLLFKLDIINLYVFQ